MTDCQCPRGFDSRTQPGTCTLCFKPLAQRTLVREPQSVQVAARDLRAGDVLASGRKVASVDTTTTPGTVYATLANPWPSRYRSNGGTLIFNHGDPLRVTR